jgi:hypothetical protein
MKKYLVHIVWLVIAIVALGGGYFLGKASGATSRAAGFAGAYSSSTRRAAGGAAGGGLITGTIATLGSSSITLQLANGNSEVVFYSTSTPVSEPTTVSVNALKVGTTIIAGGTSNSDGSLTALTLQVRPAGTTSGGYGVAGSGASAGQ